MNAIQNPRSKIQNPIWWFLAAAMVSAPRAWATDQYPTEAYPTTSEIEALNGTTDDNTGLAYIANNASPASNPPLQIQIDRRWQRQNAILATGNAGRVVKVDDTHIGVFPIDFRLTGTDHHYVGSTSTAVTTTDDVYYVYLVSDGGTGGTLTQVTDAVGWPADITTFVPLAEVTVASNVIDSITDVRNRLAYATVTSGAAASTGVDGNYFILDQDNAVAEADSDVRFNRGSTAADGALRWNATDDLFELFSEIGGPTYGALKVLRLESVVATGTPPLTVASETVVTNLNADAVDGLDFTAPAAANAIAFATSTSAVEFTAAPSADDVLYAAAGVPTWGPLGATSGVQAYDADLDGLAAVAATGMIARTAAGTFAARTLTAGNSVSIADGDGVSGNPTISVAGATQYAVQVGSSAGALSSISVGSDNTVLVGTTGGNPLWRKMVNNDISDAASISISKINSAAFGGLVTLNSGVLSVPTIADVCLASVTITADSEQANAIDVLIEPLNFISTPYRGVMEIWLADSDMDGEAQEPRPISSTAATSIAIASGGTWGARGSLIETITTGLYVRAIPANGDICIRIQADASAHTWYLMVGAGGKFASEEIVFVVD